MAEESTDRTRNVSRKDIEDAEVLIKSAEIDIKEAEKIGADLSEAKQILGEARTHLQNQNLKEVRISVKRAQTAAADAKRYHRAELLIKHARPVIESVKKAGADASRAEEYITKAKEALSNKMYGDLSEYVRAAKKEAKEAKSYHRAHLMIQNCIPEVANAKMAGADVTEAEKFLEEAVKALENKDYGVVTQLVKNAKVAATRLQKHQKVGELIAEVKPEVEELKRFGVRTEETEEFVQQAEMALERKDYAEVRSLVRKIKRRIKRAMERKGASVLIATLEHVVHKAKAKGLDVGKAKELLDKAEKALDKMDHTEIEQVISEMSTIAKGLGISVGSLAGDLFSKAKLIDLDKMDLVFSEAERKISLEMARARITAMKDLMSSARELGLNEAEFLDLLGKAEKAFDEKDFDIIEDLKEAFEEKLEEEKLKHKTDVILMKIKKVAEIISQYKELGLSVDRPEELLALAHKELQAHNFEKADEDVDEAEKLTGYLRRRHDTEEELDSLKDILSEAKSAGVDVEEANELLNKAEMEMEANNFRGAMEIIEQVRNMTSSTVQNFIQDKFPKLTLKLPETGMEADVWNRCIIEIANIGNLIAKNVDMTFRGNVEVKGVERIEKLGVGEKRKMEIGVKPKEAGELDVDVLLAYQRAFDETVYQLDLAKKIIADSTGTYSIEDVLLIHNNGILITKVSRKLVEDIDQDIFSGMLTAVQEFVRDSFRGREDVGLKRLDFAANKILIEHGRLVFITAIIEGGEPKYLPLFMMEVLREVEQKYGEVLDGWRGSFAELEGIDEIIKKLLNVAEDKGAEVEGFESGVVAPTIRLIEAAEKAGTMTGIPENFIEELVETMESEGFDKAWTYLESVEKETEKEINMEEAKSKLSSMKELMSTAKDLGLDLGEFLAIFESAKIAYDSEEFDKIEGLQNEIKEKFDEAKLKHKIEIIAKRIERGMSLISQFREHGFPVDKPQELLSRAAQELEEEKLEMAEIDVEQAENILNVKGRRMEVLSRLESVKKLLSEAEQMNVDVKEANELINQAENELKANNFEKALELIEEANTVALKARKLSDTEQKLESAKELITEAKAVGVENQEADSLLSQAESELKENNYTKAQELIEKASNIISDTVKEYINDKFPKLTLKLPEGGVEANAWNKCIVEVANIGDLLAKNIDMTFKGELDVKGMKRLEKLNTGEARRMEIGLKPKKPGELPVEVLLAYQRAFDDTIYQLDVEKTMDVDASGTFLVQDVFLIHNIGLLVSQVSRKMEEDIDRDIFSGMLTAVQEFVKDSFKKTESTGMRRMDFGENKILIEHGKYTFLVTVLIGYEPKYLPLYMLEVLKEVEAKYGSVLENWDGTYTQLEGINDIIAKLMQVTDEKGTEVEGFEESTVSTTMKLIEAAEMAGVEVSSPDAFAKELLDAMEKSGFDFTWALLEKMGKEVEKSSVEYKTRRLEIEELKHAFLKDVDEHLIRDIGDSLENYLRIVENVIKTIEEIRKVEEIKDTIPIKTVAIKSTNESVREAITKLKNPFLEKVKANNLEIVEPGMEWEGLDLEVIPNREIIIKAYKQQASKVETLLKYQSPWKIKHGIETTGGYTLGVEGYPVKITPQMVTFKITTPETVITKEYSDETTIYLDREITEDMKSKGIAGELIAHINNMRKQLNIGEEDYIETQIYVDDKTAEILEDFKEEIASKTRSYAVEFPYDNIFEGGDSGYYVVEKDLDGGKAIIGIVMVEWDEGG